MEAEKPAGRLPGLTRGEMTVAWTRLVAGEAVRIIGFWVYLGDR